MKKSLLISVLVCVCIAVVSMLPIYAASDSGSTNGSAGNTGESISSGNGGNTGESIGNGNGGNTGKSIGNDISSFGNDIRNTTDNAGNAIRNSAKDTGNGLRNATDEITDKIGNAANDVTDGVKDAMDGSDRADNNGKVTDTDGDISNDRRDTGVLDASDTAENTNAMNYVWMVIGIVAAVAALIAILLLMPKRSTGKKYKSSDTNGR